MDTAIEALFRAMLTSGWFTASTGDVESPTGYFAYGSYAENELLELFDAHQGTIDLYGWPGEKEIVGSWVVQLDTHGVIHYERCPHDNYARHKYQELEEAFTKWCDNVLEEMIAAPD